MDNIGGPSLKSPIKVEETVDITKGALNIFFIFSFGVLIATLFSLIFLGGWFLASKNSKKNLEEELNGIEAKLASLKDLDLELQSFSTALSNIQGVNASKKKWSAVFKELNAVTPKDIYYTNLSIGEDGKVQISANAPSFISVARTLVAFSSSTSFKNPVLVSFNPSERGVNFSFTVEVNPGKMLNQTGGQ